ncbi:translocation/assembly module TamB domain-containing protein [Aestuariicoccus sp. KMU-90]|uniref:Translocation/assembly module TamB domain-containing protein n=2 Tax=Thetidibacter halocola TaxID=2827239 RepID=A0A8J7WGU8_9RHOB|nr:translocation/assembly module TamB domain-containing protein [Thetidibacter halocola]
MLLPLPLVAQQDDRGFIQAKLEDALSGPGRTVRVEGFAGALSSRATIERITVSDPEGIWLSIEDVAMIWTRTALLSGRVEIDELIAARIDLPRLPIAPPDERPSPEASGTPFSLPELPVSLRLDQLSVASVTLGPGLLGEAAELSVSGSAALAGGAGDASLDIRRLDKGGELVLQGAFDNVSRVLGLNIALQEPAGGLVARKLGLHGLPSVELDVQGEAPLTDYTANIQLKTDDTDRLAGKVTLSSNAEGAQTFAMDLGGDLAPLLAPDYRAFLGPRIALLTEGQRAPDGSLNLEIFRLSAAALTLDGAARIGADGWPQRFDLSGRIAAPQGGPVLLPISGPQTRIDGATLNARFDAAEGDAWTVQALMTGLDRADLAADRVALDATGQILRAEERVTGRLRMDGTGLSPTDAGLAQALGDAMRGAFDFDWARNAPLRLSAMDLGGADYGVTGALNIDGITDNLNPVLTPDLTLAAADLSRFAALAGLDVGGAAELAITGTAEPVTGLIDLRLTGGTTDLRTGIDRVDPLLRGAGQLVLSLIRDETGTRVDPLRLETQAARVEARGSLATGASDLRIEAALTQTADVQPGLDGPSTVTATARQAGDVWTISATGTAPGNASLGFDGTVTGNGSDRLVPDGRLRASVGRLSAYSELAGRPLSGALRLEAEGRGDVVSQLFDVTATLDGTDLAAGIAQLDPLLRGASRLEVTAVRDAAGLRVEPLRLQTPTARLQARGSLVDGASNLTLDAALDRTGDILPGLDGRTTLNATATQAGEVWTVSAIGTAPGEATISYDGTVTGDGTERLALDGRLRAAIGQLSALSQLVGRPLGGALNLTAQGSGDVLTQEFDVTAALDGTSLRSGIGQVDTLLRGASRVDLRAARTGDVLTIERLAVDATGLNGTLSGQVSPRDSALQIAASLRDLGLLVPDLPGPARLSGTAASSGGDWRVDLSGTGPGGITLAARGSVAPDASRMALDLNGVAPLALANETLRPRAINGLVRFDLAVDGPPALSSVSGTLATEDARLSLPALRNAITDLAVRVQLGASRATIDATGRLATGGDLTVRGPVTLTAPFVADLQAILRNIELREPGLFETTANGTVTVAGPLQGGARIGGRIGLEQVEARIPTVGPSYKVLDGLRHVNPPADVVRTLQFAGLSLNGAPADDAGGGGPAFPLDLTIDAPSRIFVRGRGLDAELGGSLRLTGTTADVVPQGQFDLIRGRLDLLGKRLELTEGSIGLRGSFDPVIRLAATTDVDGTAITIAIAGAASDPDLSIASAPQLPEDEVLSLLLFGRSVTEISPLQAVQLAQAVRTLSGRGDGGVLDKIRSGLKLDDLDIGTTADGVAQARIGAYISENVYTNVTVSADGESEINLNLDITPALTLRGRLGSDGDTGIGVFYEKDY